MTAIPGPVEPPAGLLYREDFVTTSEERLLVTELESMDFEEVTMRGRTAKRRVRHFGYGYAYEAGAPTGPVDPLPDSLAYVLTGSARFAWQHSIPPVSSLRYSITFRTLRRSR